MRKHVSTSVAALTALSISFLVAGCGGGGGSGPLQTWYKDGDGDAYTDGTILSAPNRPAGFASDAELITTAWLDCDDADPNIHPFSLDACEDGIDQNCSGADSACQPLWQTFQGNPSHDGFVPMVLDAANFSERWSATLPNAPALNPVTAANGRVFVSTNLYFGTHQMLYTLDAWTGAVRWSHDFGYIHSVDPPAYADGKVFVQTGGHEDSFLWAFDATSGSSLFSSPYGNQWDRYYAPTPFGGNVYVGGGYYGGAYGFAGSSGDQLWYAPLNQYDSFTPAVDDTYVYAYTGEYAPALTVLNRVTGTAAFSIADPNFNWDGWSMNVAPVLGTRSDVIATQAGRLISFDLGNRQIGWEMAGTFSGQPCLANGTIYVVSAGSVQARRESDGSYLWSWVPPSGSASGTMVVTGKHLFVGVGGTTYAVDLETHQEVWSYPVSGHLALSDEGLLFIASGNGKIVAIDVVPR